mgnify:CR=1 FL=1
MQVYLIFIMVLFLALLLAVMSICLFLSYCIFLIANKSDISLPVFERWKRNKEKRDMRDKKGTESTAVLEDICLEKQNEKMKDILGENDFTFDELGQPDILSAEQPETDPDSLMALLEFGLPDEELESILSALDNEK